MTLHEAERAMIAAVPVIHQDITYDKITGLIFKKAPGRDGYTVQVELLDKCGHSVTIARLERIELASGSAEDLPEVFPPNEDGPGIWETNAKKALQSGRPFEFEGESHYVSAIIIRNWQERDYWMDVELACVRDGWRRVEWIGHIPAMH